MYNQVIEMGARQYMPSIGRFTSVDPQQGGNENPYVYPPDPVNDVDLDGNSGWFTKAASIVTKVATIGSFIPGPIGMTSSAVAVAGNIAQGHYAEAGVAALGLLGAGAATKIAAKAIDVGRAGKLAKGINAMATRVGRIQARAPGIGVNSKVFGNKTWGNKMGLFNNKKNLVRLGWSHFGPNQRSAFRLVIGHGSKAPHFDFLIGGRWR